MRKIDSIEGNEIENWAKSLRSYAKFDVISNELNGRYIYALMFEMDIENDNKILDILESRDNMASLIWTRIKHMHNYEVTKVVPLILQYLCKTPGDAVIYCNYLQYMAKQKNITRIKMENISNIFSLGFFNEQTLDKAWSDQKVYSDTIRLATDNMLDDSRFGVSIRL